MTIEELDNINNDFYKNSPRRITGRTSLLTKTEYERAVDLFVNGMTQKAVALKYDVCLESIRKLTFKVKWAITKK